VSRSGFAQQIIAGPGTGKTTELVAQISDALVDLELKSKSLIACTFTRKSAEELSQRIESVVGKFTLNSNRLMIGTIHSICLQLLREYVPEDYSDWDVLAEESQIPYVHSKLLVFGFGEEDIRGQSGWDLARECSRIFTTITDEEIDSEIVLSRLADTHVDTPSKLDKLEQILENFQTYQEALAEDKLFDFATIQRTLLHILKSNAEITQLIVEKYPRVYVDEYQDVNDIQHQIFSHLCANGSTLTVVGDDDQSIYGFRGGNVKHLVGFEAKMMDQGVSTIVRRLEVNYRSTPEIVDATNKYISSQSYPRLVKNLSAHRNVLGPAPRALQFATDFDEADWVAKEISRLRRSNTITSFRSIAILCTSVRNHSVAILRALDQANIPVQASGTGTLFEQDFALEFLGLIDFWLAKDLSPGDRDARLREHLGPSVISKLDESDYFEKVNKLVSNRKFYGSCLALMYDLFDATDFVQRHQIHGSNVGTLTKLVHSYDNFARRYDPYGLFSYLTYLRKQSEIDYIDDESRDAVQLLTIHRAKGLEFDVVFVVSQNDRQRAEFGLFDTFSVAAGREDRDEHESARVLYVAMTRARNFLAITSSKALDGRKRSYNWAPPAVAATSVGAFESSDNIPHLPASEFTDFASKRKLMPVLSYNAIHLYRICPLQYRFAQVDRLETVRIGGIQFGVNMHRVIEQLLRIRKEGKELDTEIVANLIEKFWRDLPTRPDDENVKFRSSGQVQLENFVTSFAKELEASEIAGIEEPFSLSVGSTKIVGRLDLRLERSGSSQIVDFKTGDDDDYSEQLSLYAACLTELAGLDVGALGVYFLKSGRLVTIEPSDNRLQIELIEAIAEKIAAGNFEPTPGKHCGDCAYSTICPYSQSRKRRGISKS